MMKNGFDMGLNDFESIDVKKIAHTLQTAGGKKNILSIASAMIRL